MLGWLWKPTEVSKYCTPLESFE